MRSMVPARRVEVNLVPVSLGLLDEAGPLLGRRRPTVPEHVAVTPRLAHALAVVEGWCPRNGLALVQCKEERLLFVIWNANEEVHAHVIRPDVRGEALGVPEHVVEDIALNAVTDLVPILPRREGAGEVPATFVFVRVVIPREDVRLAIPIVSAAQQHTVRLAPEHEDLGFQGLVRRPTRDEELLHRHAWLHQAQVHVSLRCLLAEDLRLDELNELVDLSCHGIIAALAHFLPTADDLLACAPRQVRCLDDECIHLIHAELLHGTAKSSCVPIVIVSPEVGLRGWDAQALRCVLQVDLVLHLHHVRVDEALDLVRDHLLVVFVANNLCGLVEKRLQREVLCTLNEVCMRRCDKAASNLQALRLQRRACLTGVLIGEPVARPRVFVTGLWIVAVGALHHATMLPVLSEGLSEAGARTHQALVLHVREGAGRCLCCRPLGTCLAEANSPHAGQREEQCETC
mmetsp:Transcript_2472/g.6176  ORF Transcript_2472/g.6176 Transcript_2472/m.6176 type:complete len:459 (-) Transcript_2472:73-1449(-)